jgi:UPF0755 protein
LTRGNRSQPGHERTAEERERDRVERERRRTGAPAAPPRQEPTREPVSIEPTVEPRPVEPRPIEPMPAEPRPVEPRALEQATTEHEPIDPAPAEQPPVEQMPGERALAEQAPARKTRIREAAEAPPAESEPEVAFEPELPAPRQGETQPRFIPADPYAALDPVAQERPAWDVDARPEPARMPVVSEGGRSRAGRAGRGRLAERRTAGIAAGTGRGGGRGGKGRRGAGARARAGAGGGRRFTRARIAALLTLAAAVVLVWFLVSLFQPFAGEGTGKVIVQIPTGSSSSKIGSILAREHVVSSGFFFNLRALLEGKHSSLHSGRFQLKREMSYSAAIDALSKPPPKVIAVKVVVPEGYTRRQIANLVGEDALSGSYLATTEHSRLLNPRHYGAPAGTSSLEGFLFPATYELTAGAPVKRLVDEQLTAFRERFTAEDSRRARELHVTPYQLVTVASMIEREAQTEHDRPRIAAVIYNRLKEGIPLGIDATIYYAVELQKGIATYTGELTESQLKIDSPYNSRTHKGLPPTPISNPGEASIRAAAHPSHVPYLYYVAGADGCGEQVFSKTYAEFEKNVAAYDAAVKKNGGRPPACKKK